MANTYELITSHTTASGGESAFTFSSIASTWTDLLIKISARTTRTASTFDNIWVTFNGSTAANYSSKLLYGLSTSAGSNGDSGVGQITFAGYATTNADTSNTFSNTEFYIPNYASSNNKILSGDSVNENNATDGGINTLSAGLWAYPSAITSVTLTAAASPFVQYSSFYLYGIKNS